MKSRPGNVAIDMSFSGLGDAVPVELNNVDPARSLARLAISEILTD
jgi:hypothetical protein